MSKDEGRAFEVSPEVFDRLLAELDEPPKVVPEIVDMIKRRAT